MRRLILLVTAISVAHAANPLSESAQRKLDAISNRQVPRGSTVTFSPEEISAWGHTKVVEVVPEGMRDERVELGSGTATGYALVDFLKMRHAKGQDTNWLMARLIEGERPLKVSVRIESGGGKCVVHLTRVEISNVSANQTVLEFLIKTFFMPLYPDAHINEPFDLDFDIDRIDVTPSAAKVVIKK